MLTHIDVPGKLAETNGEFESSMATLELHREKYKSANLWHPNNPT